MEITKQLQIKSFLGVPIILKNGEMFATLCAMDTKPYRFTQENIALLQSMATFLAYVIELENTEDLYRQLVESSPDGMVVHRDGHILYTNPSGAELFGTTHQQHMIGRSVQDLLEPEPQHVPSETKSEFTEQKVLRLDGQSIQVETTETPLMYQGKPAVQLMMRDISERKHVEEMLRRSEKLSILGELAAGIAHEIRNPLTAMRGFTQLLSSTSDESKKYCDFILPEIDRINFIVSEFLFLAKPQAMDLQANDPLVLLEDVIYFLESQANLNNVQIETTFEPDIPLVTCGNNQLKQVFMNILKNAIESMPSGGTVHILAKAQHNDVVFTFTDQGDGIPEELIPSLGRPFFTTKEKGTGLGLMISARIIEAHQGKLAIRSEINKGTTVEISLPFR
jgi:two-component system sporulation sensor kinase A